MPRPTASSPRRTPPARNESASASPAERPRPVHPPFEPPPATLAVHDRELQAHLDRLAAEFDSLKGQLRHAQRLAAIGTNAAVIAHEFNNLFTPVVAYAQHALDAGDNELMRKALAKTLERVGIMRQMSDRLIGMAKQSERIIKAVNVLSVVQAAIECLGRDPAKDNLTVSVQVDPALAVRADENGLIQVLFNLVINARQAMLDRGRGRLTIDAAPTTDGQVEINVRDTGCGIAPDNLPHIFEPFFSTKTHADKPDKRGLGLGLSISRDIIEDLGGRISVSSRLDVGTTFTITLPPSE
ncbi:MAG: hypothetical protein AMXMBFR83_15150 [Phycisphaerae bacterium]